MRKVATVVALVTGAALFFAGPFADACGDKLLSIARGARLQQVYKSQHPASILLYIGDPESATNSRDRSALVQMGLLYMSLRQAGHRLDVAESTSELDQILQSGDFDLVLADIRHVGVAAEGVAGHPSRVSAYPVLYKPDEVELADARKRFELVLKTPATSTDHLEAIDQLLSSGSGGR